MSYDEKCYDLAASFLADEPLVDTEANRVTLARTIQDVIEQTIEGFIEDEPKREQS